MSGGIDLSVGWRHRHDDRRRGRAAPGGLGSRARHPAHAADGHGDRRGDGLLHHLHRRSSHSSRPWPGCGSRAACVTSSATPRSGSTTRCASCSAGPRSDPGAGRPGDQDGQLHHRCSSSSRSWSCSPRHSTSRHFTVRADDLRDGRQQRGERAVRAADGPARGPHEDRRSTCSTGSARRWPASPTASTSGLVTGRTRPAWSSTVIAAVVIGGTPLTGGEGYLLGALFGVLITALIQSLIQFNGELELVVDEHRDRGPDARVHRRPEPPGQRTPARWRPLGSARRRAGRHATRDRSLLATGGSGSAPWS